METPNQRRARQACQALTAFCLATRRRALGALDPDEALSDLLCDLRHLADRRDGLDYARADRRAARHHRDEVLEAGELAA